MPSSSKKWMTLPEALRESARQLREYQSQALKRQRESSGQSETKQPSKKDSQPSPAKKYIVSFKKVNK